MCNHISRLGKGCEGLPTPYHWRPCHQIVVDGDSVEDPTWTRWMHLRWLTDRLEINNLCPKTAWTKLFYQQGVKWQWLALFSLRYIPGTPKYKSAAWKMPMKLLLGIGKMCKCAILSTELTFTSRLTWKFICWVCLLHCWINDILGFLYSFISLIVYPKKIIGNLFTSAVLQYWILYTKGFMKISHGILCYMQ